jgi:hypothetical protein
MCLDQVNGFVCNNTAGSNNTIIIMLCMHVIMQQLKEQSQTPNGMYHSSASKRSTSSPAKNTPNSGIFGLFASVTDQVVSY